MLAKKLGCLLLALPACVAPSDEATVSTTESHLNIASTKIWPSTNIPVCWENSGRDADRARVRAAVKRTWEATTGVVFEGWGICQSGARGIRIRHQDSWPGTQLGTDVDGLVDGMILNFDFTFTKPDGSQPFSGCIGANREYCIDAIAVHEFGHALGFAHEQNRTDTPDTCTEAPQGGDGATTVGDWDLMSVMNYCNPHYNGDGILSTNDVAGAQMYYGRPAGQDQQFFAGDTNGDGYGDLIQTYRGFASIPTCVTKNIGAFRLLSCTNPAATIYDAGSPQQQFVKGDFNADGKTDVAQVYRNFGSIPRCLSTGSGWSCDNPAAELHTGAGDTNERRFLTGKFLRDDNRTGIIQTYRGWGSIPLCTATATGWSCSNPAATIHNSGSREQEFHVADFNGDGLDDVLQTHRTWGSFPVCFATGTGGWSCRDDVADVYDVATGETRFLTGDVNGDRRADVLQVSRHFHSIPVCKSKLGGTGFVCSNPAATIYDSGSHEQQFLTGDFNGDGLIDVAQTYRGWSSIPVCFATSAGTWDCHNDAALVRDSGSVEQRFLAVDMNKDGKTDIVSTHRGAGKYVVCYSNGAAGWTCEEKGTIYDPNY